MGKPQPSDEYDRYNDIIGYLKQVGSLSQAFVIVLPIFVIILNIIYLVFRIKNHDWMWECSIFIIIINSIWIYCLYSNIIIVDFSNCWLIRCNPNVFM